MMNECVERKRELSNGMTGANCAFIAREIQDVALDLVYYCSSCGEDFRVRHENLIDDKFYRCPVCGSKIRFEELKKMSLSDYFINDFVFYHMYGNKKYKGAELVLHRGAEMYLLDTRQGILRNTAGGVARIDMVFVIKKIDAFCRSIFEKNIRRRDGFMIGRYSEEELLMMSEEKVQELFDAGRMCDDDWQRWYNLQDGIRYLTKQFIHEKIGNLEDVK